jgi:hypothetical protein
MAPVAGLQQAIGVTAVTIEIAISRGLVAVVDDEDAYLADLRWYAAKGANTYYAMRSDKRPRRHGIYLHRLVLGLPPWERGGLEVDHIDRDGLNNRRSNLRAVTHQENALNRTDTVTSRLCLTCGSTYRPSHPRAKFCSVRCSRLQPGHGRNRRFLADQVCPICGVVFAPRSHLSVVCSNTCAPAQRAATRRAKKLRLKGNR